VNAHNSEAALASLFEPHTLRAPQLNWGRQWWHDRLVIISTHEREQVDLESFFAGDHQRCDDAWSEVESAAQSEDAQALRSAWSAFETLTLAHLAMEEDVLFPLFEQATGRTMGPTQIMRQEHEQMRALLRGIAACCSAGDFEGTLNQGDTLLMLTQQHNQKEEGVLYPMANDALGAQWPEIRGRLQRYL
jgi:hemerythrin-like domain-containing protein